MSDMLNLDHNSFLMSSGTQTNPSELQINVNILYIGAARQMDSNCVQVTCMKYLEHQACPLAPLEIHNTPFALLTA